MTPNEWLFNQLGQECNEVAHRISKLLQFGSDEVEEGQPGQGEGTNAERVRGEMLDVFAVYKMLVEARLIQDVDDKSFAVALSIKEDRVRRWLAYSQQVGATEPGTFGPSPVARRSS